MAFATVLLLLQIGIYRGFISTASALIDHMGGDLWVMARGTEVTDNGEPLSAGDAVQVVGFEPPDAAYPRPTPLVPWELARGLPGDLHPLMRESVDTTDLKKLLSTATSSRAPRREAPTRV